MTDEKKWFTEVYEDRVKFSYQIDRVLHEEQTKFQKLEIVNTLEFGRMMILDGFVMLTERDEFVYHEMISHIPMAFHHDVKNVLVIGGGDGGTVTEYTKYALSLIHI